MSDHTAADRHFLNYAIKLGRRGLGTTAPNPSVGAVVVGQSDVGEDVILGEATTATSGRPHAEPQAVAMAGGNARGATLYVSLEPCSHHGHTPPCTDAIISAGIRRVVCELADPDPRVSSDGFSILERAGLTVTRLPPSPTAAMAHAGHIRRVTRGRPFVTVKLAVSKDGKIAAGTGAPVWVTSPQARARGHMYRATHDAILVGAGTMRADDPALTCRLPGLCDQSPIPIVLDSSGNSVTGSRLQTEQNERLMIFTKTGAALEQSRCFEVPTDVAGRLDLTVVLNKLHQDGITSVLIEGGPTVALAFIQARLVDEVVVFRGAEALGREGQAVFGAQSMESILNGENWDHIQALEVGPDTMSVYHATNLVSELTGTRTCSQD